MRRFSISLGIVGLIINMLGGLSALFGVYLIAFKAGVQMFGWGDASTFGYLFFCAGLCFVFAGLVLAKYTHGS